MKNCFTDQGILINAADRDIDDEYGNCSSLGDALLMLTVMVKMEMVMMTMRRMVTMIVYKLV